MGALATGVPAWPEIRPGYDLSPLLLIAVAIVLAPLVFRLRLTPWSVAALSVGATLTAWFAGTIGWLPALAIGFLVLRTGSTLMHRRTGRG